MSQPYRVELRVPATALILDKARGSGAEVCLGLLSVRHDVRFKINTQPQTADQTGQLIREQPATSPEII